MHPSLTRSPLPRAFRAAWSAMVLAGVLAASATAQTPIAAGGGNGTAVQRADALLRDGRRAAAADLLGQHLAEQPTDGRAWFHLGRIYLGDAQRWHRENHTGEPTGALLLDFAGAAFEQAQQLLADSGSVYRVLVATERTTLQVEQGGWSAATAHGLAAEDLPLPPVLGELGRNLLASCPKRGVLVTGSLVETAAAWGTRLLDSTRTDLILLRPDVYAYDARYRARMAAAIGADSTVELPAALVQAGASRPICLTPSVDSLTAPSLEWRAVRLVLTSGPTDPRAEDPITVHLFARTGLAGSVWSEAVRDVYDLAARRNRSLCQTLFGAADAQGLPTIASCPR